MGTSPRFEQIDLLPLYIHTHLTYRVSVWYHYFDMYIPVESSFYT